MTDPKRLESAAGIDIKKAAAFGGKCSPQQEHLGSAVPILKGSWIDFIPNMEKQ
jgi:hypothetical protein